MTNACSESFAGTLSSSKAMTIEIDQHSTTSWTPALGTFADASIYQSLEYASARWPADGISTLKLLTDGRPAALAMARVLQFPFSLGGIAYVGWGPAWSTIGNAAEVDTLRSMVRALRNEYAVRRGLQLRVVPNIYSDNGHPAKQVFLEEGFEWAPRADATIFLDLSPTLTELRAQLRRSWRQVLVKAEKAGLMVEQGTDTSLYDAALDVYREMHARKRFTEFVDKAQFRAMQQALAANQKMQILVVRENETVVAAIAWSVIGTTGLPLLAATTARALETGAGNLMWWRMIEWMKLNGFSRCDLGGVDQAQNPGGYIFKSGIAGSQCAVVPSLGEFNCCERPLTSALVRTGTFARNALRRARVVSERWQKRRSTVARQ